MEAKQQICAVGSCQSTMVAKMLRLNPAFAERFDIWAPAKQVYQMDDADIAQFHDRLADVDVLLAQPVTSEYRSPRQSEMPSGSLSTQTLLSKIKPDGRGLLVPVMFFNFYHPSYFRPGMNTPTANHDINLLQLYARKAGEPLGEAQIDSLVAEFLDIVGNDRLYDPSALLARADKAIAGLREREGAMLQTEYARPVAGVTISDFISDTYRDQALFSTVNHPKQPMYDHLLERICEALYVPFEPLPPLAPHEDDMGFYYQAIQNVVSFDVGSYEPRLNDVVGTGAIARSYIHAYEANREQSMPLAMKFASRATIPTA